MDQARILLIGQAGPYRNSPFSDPPNLSEFNAILWYPQTIGTEWRHYGARRSVEQLSKLIEWVKRGNTLVVFGCPPDDFTAAYQKDSGFYKSDFLKTEIFRGITFRKTSGFLLEFCGEDQLEKELSRLAQYLHYDAILDSNELIPLFRVSTARNDETQIVGGYKKLGGGVVAFLPPLADATPQSPEFYLYHFAAASILETLSNSSIEDAPPWLDTFQTKEENKIGLEISAAQTSIRTIEERIKTLEQDRNSERADKRLFTATGDNFANSVAAALREIDLRVVEGPKQRADLIVRCGERLAALEVKGLEGGAREKNIAQVNRWVADITVALTTARDEADHDIKAYQIKLTELGVPNSHAEQPSECKGIVVLNTHRKIPINERPESYGSPVTKIIIRSGVCALTGLQLFTILRDVRENRVDRTTIIDKLFRTKGLLDEGLLWDHHLTHAS